MEFHEKRRQQFLTEAAYTATTRFHNDISGPGYLRSLSRHDFDSEDRSGVADAYADDTFTNYMLRYTAGESIHALREDLEKVIAAFEQATHYVREHEKNPIFPPLRFIEIDEYERVLQMIGLCFLLHRRDLLPRIAMMFDPAAANQDTLYEDMLAFSLEGRFDVDRWYHDVPYRDLVNTIYCDSDDECLDAFTRYLKNWYTSLAKAPWHDSHLNIEDDTCAGYFGYWAIEAAALAYLLEFDDTSFSEHLVYPKDLVDFARAMDMATETSATESGEGSRMRVEGGRPCPQAGFWTTPAQQNSRRYFNAGEIMPTYGHSAYGATIWQWSDQQ
jgi:hypothetical protein